MISIDARVKVPGEAMHGEPVELVAQHTNAIAHAQPYERLLADAMRGDPALFGRDDSIEAAWRIVDPVLGDATPVGTYEPGTWGPKNARDIVASEEGWHDPKPDPAQ